MTPIAEWSLLKLSVFECIRTGKTNAVQLKGGLQCGLSKSHLPIFNVPLSL